MKKLCLLFSVLFIAFSGYAQSKKVALHHNGATSLFTGNSGFVNAVAAAVSGDTIYVPGGFWGASNISKKLTIYGAGHYPDSTLATQATQFTGSFTFTPGSDSSLFQGVHVNGVINITSSDYITINRCKFTSSTINDTSEHIIYSENVITTQLNVANKGDYISIRNNFFTADGNLQPIVGIVQGALIENNVFNNSLGSNYCCYFGTFASVNGSLIRNNVLMGTHGTYWIQGCSNNTFANNLFTVSPNYGTNTATGNYEAVVDTSIFVNWSGLNQFSYSDDYHLQSPTTYLGTDSTQVGLYGGLNPYKMGSVPANPHIRENNTANQTDASGNLNVDIKVGAQNR